MRYASYGRCPYSRAAIRAGFHCRCPCTIGARPGDSRIPRNCGCASSNRRCHNQDQRSRVRMHAQRCGATARPITISCVRFFSNFSNCKCSGLVYAASTVTGSQIANPETVWPLPRCFGQTVPNTVAFCQLETGSNRRRDAPGSEWSCRLPQAPARRDWDREDTEVSDFWLSREMIRLRRETALGLLKGMGLLPRAAFCCGRPCGDNLRSRRRRAIVIERQIKSYDAVIRDK